MERLLAWLGPHVPPDDGRVSLVHGDWRIDNMIFDAHSARLLAVLDWELSTLGHPFADLAYQCMYWRLPSGWNGLGGVDREAIGVPTEAEYVEAYCRRGRGLRAFRTGPSFSPSASFASRRSRRASSSARSTATPRTPSAPGNTDKAVPMMARLAMDEIEGRR